MLTARYIRDFGEYMGYCEDNQAYIYIVGDKEYLWNGKGVIRVKEEN